MLWKQTIEGTEIYELSGGWTRKLKHADEEEHYTSQLFTITNSF